MDTSEWTRESIAWLAGLLEGEGAFLRTNKRTAAGVSYPIFRIALNMADEDVVGRAARIAGAGRARGPFSQKNPKHKPFWRWGLDKRDEVYALCVALYPYMGERRKLRITEILLAYRTSGMKKWAHGSITGYQEYKCRCSECRAANAAKSRENRKRRKEKSGATSVRSS